MTDLYKLKVLKFHFKLRHSDLPCHFMKDLEILNDTCYNYNLRNNTIRTPSHHHSFAILCILFNCFLILLLTRLIRTHSLNGFSIYVKRWLLDEYIVECHVVICFTCLKK